MKKIVKASAVALAISLVLPGVTRSYASSSSAFARNSKYSAAYSKLTSTQQRELDTMNTDGRAPLTLKELEAYGKYTTPIVKGVDWLYPFMYDKDGDGMVGEGAGRYDGYESTSSNDTNKDEAENLAEANKKDDIEEETQKEEESTTDESQEFLYEEEKNTSEINKILDITSKIDALSRLEEAVSNAQFKIDMAENLLENYPNTVRNVREDLIRLIEKSKALIERSHKYILEK